MAGKKKDDIFVECKYGCKEKGKALKVKFKNWDDHVAEVHPEKIDEKIRKRMEDKKPDWQKALENDTQFDYILVQMNGNKMEMITKTPLPPPLIWEYIKSKLLTGAKMMEKNINKFYGIE